jgi:large subunit ribosomal protein L30
MAKIAVIRIKGLMKKKTEDQDTLSMLRLYNKNHCTVVEDTPQNMGMIKKEMHLVTYGEIDDSTFNELLEKRGEEYTGPVKDSKGKIDYSRRFIVLNGKKYKKYFRLSPPKKGYGRKGVKKPFSKSGALGYRGTEINDLIRRMI